MATINRKIDPNEEINIGDVLMVSPDTQRVTKAIKDKGGINDRLIVGVCTASDNSTPMPSEMNGGNSRISKTKRIMLSGGNSNQNVITFKGGNSNLRPREIVTTETCGAQIVNINHYADLGDKLVLSGLGSGKAEAIDILNYNKFNSRTIGKVIKFTENKGQVVCLLNIE